MKTVLHILNSSSYSGAENVVITIIETFAKINKDVNFVYASPDGQIRHLLKEKGILFEPIKRKSLTSMRQLIKKYNPDIIHAHDFTASILSSMVCGKTPIISHLHNNCLWLKKPGCKSLAYLISCHKYKYILGVSESVFKEYVFGNRISKKTHIVGNPVNIRKVMEFAEKDISDERYDICFLGRLSEQKNPIRFIEFIAELSKTMNISAVMIGNGELRKEVEDKIKMLNCEDIITLKGFLNNPYSLLKKTKILCIPSKWEGFGLVAVEALSLGVPVVASEVGGLPGIVNEKCGKLCNTDEEFLCFMRELITQKKTWEKYSEGALQRAEELDNVEDYCMQLNGFYEKLV